MILKTSKIYREGFEMASKRAMRRRGCEGKRRFANRKAALIDLSSAASLMALIIVSEPTVSPPNGLRFELPPVIAPEA